MYDIGHEVLRRPVLDTRETNFPRKYREVPRAT